MQDVLAAQSLAQGLAGQPQLLPAENVQEHLQVGGVQQAVQTMHGRCSEPRAAQWAVEVPVVWVADAWKADEMEDAPMSRAA